MNLAHLRKKRSALGLPRFLLIGIYLSLSIILTSTAYSDGSGGSTYIIGGAASNKKVHVFTASGNFNVPLGTTITNVEYLIVGGGGSAGAGFTSSGGGGGGGAVRAGTFASLAGGTYSINVGSGGTPSGAYGQRGSNGGTSFFYAVFAFGGGAGGTFGDSRENGTNGGSGGGGAGHSVVGLGGSSAAGGNVGGSGFSSSVSGDVQSAGGGGGANSAGSAGTNGVSGNGGDGILSSISGSSVIYGGGGGGGKRDNGVAGLGGSGGGGKGAGGSPGVGGVFLANGQDGVSGRGGGGGGGGTIWPTAFSAGGAGGSGIVIISYTTAAAADSMSVNGLNAVNIARKTIQEIVAQTIQNAVSDNNEFLLDAANTNFFGMTDKKNSYFKRNDFQLLPIVDINENKYFSAISMTSSVAGPEGNSILKLQGKVILAGGRGKDKNESIKFGLKHETRTSESSIIGLGLNVNIQESDGKIVNQGFTNSSLESYTLTGYRSQKLNKDSIFVSSIIAKHLSVDVYNQTPELRIAAEATQNLLGLSFLIDSRYQGIYQNINYVSKIGMQTYFIDKAETKISAQENDFTGNFDTLADSDVMNLPFVNLGIEQSWENSNLALNAGLVCNFDALDEFAKSKCTRNTKIELTRDLNLSSKIKASCSKQDTPARPEWMCATALEIKF